MGGTMENSTDPVELSAKTDIEAPPVKLVVTEKDRDPDLVDWDGPDDPENPFNWPSYKKWRQLIFMAINTFLTYVPVSKASNSTLEVLYTLYLAVYGLHIPFLFSTITFWYLNALANKSHSPLASSMFTPGVADIQKEFGSDSTMMASFLVSIYVLGYVVGPFLIAPLSELYGRIPLYHTCNICLLIFTIACAVSQSLPQLLVFRLLAGIAGVCPLTIGSGTVADMVYKEKRAGVMAIWAMGPYMGPVVGPVAGGFLVEAEGWRWVFWVLAITVCFHTLSTWVSKCLM